MTRQLEDVVSASLEDPVIYPFFAIELLFDGEETLRLWTGQGTLMNKGVQWFGTGTLLSIETIEETSELAAKGATVGLSGVPSEVLALALTQPYQGRQAKIYMGMFTTGELLLESEDFILLEDGGMISLETQETSFTEIFAGYMDTMNIEESAETSIVSLALENKLIDLERPRTSRYTSSFQKSRYPNDRGFEFIEGLQDKELFWGRTTA